MQLLFERAIPRYISGTPTALDTSEVTDSRKNFTAIEHLSGAGDDTLKCVIHLSNACMACKAFIAGIRASSTSGRLRPTDIPHRSTLNLFTAPSQLDRSQEDNKVCSQDKTTAMLSKSSASSLRRLVPAIARSTRRPLSTTQSMHSDMDTAAFGEQHIAKASTMLLLHAEHTLTFVGYWPTHQARV